MITYTNKILTLDIENYSEEYPKVVIRVSGAIEAEDVGAFARYSFEESFEFTPGQPFTPYEELTENQVFFWVFEKWGETKYAAIRAELSQKIYIQLNPPPQTNNLTPPWIK